MKLRLFLAIALLSSCASDIPRMPRAPSSALSVATIRTDSDARFAALLEGASDNTILTNYSTDRPSTWGHNFTQRFDFTAVAWDDGRTVTAISPLHVVMAAHYQRPAGSTVVFNDRRGRPQRRTLVAVESLGMADVAVGKLDAPLPSGVRPYRILPPAATYKSLVGCLAVVTDQKRRAFIHEIESFPGGPLSVQRDGQSFAVLVSFRHNKRIPAHLRKDLIAGDSGHPSFLLVGGELVLIETHTVGGGGAGPFFSSPPLFSAIEAAMTKLGGGYRLSVVPLAGN